MWYGQGNNIAGALVPGGPPTVPDWVALSPAQTSTDVKVENSDTVDVARPAEDELYWHDWTGTRLGSAAWGADAHLLRRARELLGTDTPRAALLHGRVRLFVQASTGTGSTPEHGNSTRAAGADAHADGDGDGDDTRWTAAAASDLGALAYSPSEGLCYLPTLADLAAGKLSAAVRLQHPLLAQQQQQQEAADITICSTYTLFLLTTPRDVFTVACDRRTGQPALAMVDDLSGLGPFVATSGGGRFAVTTAAGGAYLVDDKGVRAVEIWPPSLGERDEDDLELEPFEVRSLAVGDGWEAAIAHADDSDRAGGNLYVRGSNEFGQLGSCVRAKDVRSWRKIDAPGPGRLCEVRAGRFSLLVRVDPSETTS